MKLSELLLPLSGFRLEIASPNSRAPILDQEIGEITGIVSNSKQVEPQQVFVAVKGNQFDGHDEIASALRQGAAFIIAQDPEKLPPDLDPRRVLLVNSTRKSLSVLAHQFYGNPSNALWTIGVTGTNGKTSTTYFLEHLLRAQNIETGVMGTINHHLGAKVWSTNLTTSDPILIASRMKEFKELGAKAIAMEVSSHALDQHRADGVRFNGAIFTNLTRDHLDYHQTMPQYFAAKQRLFADLLHGNSKTSKAAAINIDDPWGKKLMIAPGASLITYGQHAVADMQIQITQQTISGIEFSVKTSQGILKAKIPMCGVHNVYNAVGAVAVLSRLGIATEKSLLDSLANFSGVPGRLESVTTSQPFHVFVDYAHTPDGLQKAVETLRPLTKGRLITVFGCGGDRDQGKRPQMTKIAVQSSNVAILTSDNPRTEDPSAILQQMLEGVSVPSTCETHSIVDRRQAIEIAIKNAKAHDVVLIAGKGHEDYQIIGTEKFSFDDRVVAKEFL